MPPVKTLLQLFMDLASWKILSLTHLTNALVICNITKSDCVLWAVPK